jgi:SUKH-3 immunity protein
MIDLPSELKPFFLEAGWTPQLKAQSKPNDHPAAQLLAQFSGLSVGGSGEGVECATSSLSFRGSDEEEPSAQIEMWQRALGVSLVSIAEVDDGYAELYIDSKGRFFGRSHVHEAFFLVGESFAAAMKALLLGYRCRPMLLPGQKLVTLYGHDFKSDSPALYRY